MVKFLTLLPPWGAKLFQLIPMMMMTTSAILTHHRLDRVVDTLALHFYQTQFQTLLHL
jgi:hypothetical protein